MNWRLVLSLMIGFIGLKANLDAASISHVMVSNINSRSFVVTWISSDFGWGRIFYGTDPIEINITLADARLYSGTSFYDPNFDQDNTQTHIVLLSALNPATTYYFQIMSGGELYLDEGGVPFEATTAPQLPLPPSMVYSIGSVTHTSNHTTVPADGALVQFSFYNAAGVHSNLMSTVVVSNSHSYMLSTQSVALRQDLSNYYPFDLAHNFANDYITISSFGGWMGYRQMTLPVAPYIIVYGGAIFIQIDLALQKGDTNLDGEVNTADLTPVTDTILQPNAQLLAGQSFAAADINFDGLITIIDAVRWAGWQVEK